MNPYATPTMNINVNPQSAYSQDELSAMQQAAMQEYVEKERAYEAAKAMGGYGGGSYFLSSLGGGLVGGLAGYGLGRAISRSVAPIGAGVGALGGMIAGPVALSVREDRKYPGVRAARDLAYDELDAAETHLSDVGELNPQLYEYNRVRGGYSSIPKHELTENERAYNNVMLAQQKEALRNAQLDRHLKYQQLYRSASFLDEADHMIKLAGWMDRADYELESRLTARRYFG